MRSPANIISSFVVGLITEAAFVYLPAMFELLSTTCVVYNGCGFAIPVNFLFAEPVLQIDAFCGRGGP